MGQRVINHVCKSLKAHLPSPVLVPHRGQRAPLCWSAAATCRTERACQSGGALLQSIDPSVFLKGPAWEPVWLQFVLCTPLGARPGSQVGKIWLQKHRSGAGLQSGSECCEAGGSVSAAAPAAARRRHTSVRKIGRRGRESGCEGYPQCASRRSVGGGRKHGRVSLAESPHCACAFRKQILESLAHVCPSNTDGDAQALHFAGCGCQAAAASGAGRPQRRTRKPCLWQLSALVQTANCPW